MKKIILICEGPTEQEFCDKVLRPHFDNLGIEIEYPIILHSNGGIVKWQHLVTQINLHHAADSTAHITTFIDYYGIEVHHNFPDWALAHAEADKNARMVILEAGMKNSLNGAAQTQFIPYIQLHEFEALILSDRTAFDRYYAPEEFNAAALTAICSNPPESVNSGRTTAPSKRLEANITVFDKVTDGAELSLLIGLTNIRAACPRFNNWIANLEAI
ncbi:MAG: DUF4276 family protein [Chitinophagaceae bacterium]|nr:MAG: DUF4276 family protein [Chitinophagaceae bacterium]